MKSSFSAVASKALLLAFTSAITFGSVTSSAQAKFISQAVVLEEEGNHTPDGDDSSAQGSVHTMYDMFDRPVLTYSTSRKVESDEKCSTPSNLQNSVEQFYSTLFKPACLRHDYGYGHAPWQKAGFDSFTGKIIADNRFMVDMLLICQERFDSPSEAEAKVACDVASILYVEAVKVASNVDWQGRQNRYTADPHTQVMATMPIDPRTVTKYAALNRLSQDIFNTRSTILQEREIHLSGIRDARAVFEEAQNEVAKIRRDITTAQNRIAQLNREIRAKEVWFRGLNAFQKIGGTAELAAYAAPRRAEQGTLYTAIATLEAARLSATAALEAPRQTLRGLEAAFQAAHGAPIEADPRLVSLMAEYIAISRI